MKFEYVLGLLKSNIHLHPEDKQKEVDFVIRMLSEGIGYLTKRTEKNPYCKVIFYDDNARE